VDEERGDGESGDGDDCPEEALGDRVLLAFALDNRLRPRC
jgi:hypothetical protein